MYTLEEKVNHCLEMLVCTDPAEFATLRTKACDMLNTTESASTENNTVDDLIADIFRDIGIPMNLAGYAHLKHAVKLVYNNPTYYKGSITTRLYPDVAVEFDTTKSRTERVMRHAISTSCLYGDWDAIIDVFGSAIHSNKGAPTNSQFIITVADLVSRKMRSR